MSEFLEKASRPSEDFLPPPHTQQSVSYIWRHMKLRGDAVLLKMKALQRGAGSLPKVQALFTLHTEQKL